MKPVYSGKARYLCNVCNESYATHDGATRHVKLTHSYVWSMAVSNNEAVCHTVVEPTPLLHEHGVEKFREWFWTDQIQPGVRIRMIEQSNYPVPPGSLGTIEYSYSGALAQIMVRWDEGRTLNVVPRDKFEVIGFDDNFIIPEPGLI